MSILLIQFIVAGEHAVFTACAVGRPVVAVLNLPRVQHIHRTVRFMTCTIAISSAANTSTRANRAMPSHSSPSKSTNPKTKPSAHNTNSYQTARYKAVSP